MVARDGGGSPAEGAQRGQPRERLEELRVQRRLLLEVEEAQLPRCAQVAALQVEVEEAEEGEADGDVVGRGGEEACLGEDGEEAWRGGEWTLEMGMVAAVAVGAEGLLARVTTRARGRLLSTMPMSWEKLYPPSELMPPHGTMSGSWLVCINTWW